MNATLTGGRTYQGMREVSWTQPLPSTILLVEDEPGVRMVTRDVLELGGYHVLEAESPLAALRLADKPEFTIDLLLTDIIMPGMNGADLARAIRKQRPTIATLFMTGYTESEALRLATLEAGIRHIQKPFTVKNLLARVAEALEAGPNAGDEPPHDACP